MPISEYRSYIARLTDTKEYRELLERFWKSQILYEKKDSDQTAAFLFYVLPLAGDDWEARTYSGQATSSYPADEARLEYSFTMTILRPDRVMVKDYDDIRLGMMEMMQDILRNRTKEELRDEAVMRADIQAYVDEMLTYMQTEEVSITMEFEYFSLAEAEKDQQGLTENGGRAEREKSGHVNGTEEESRRHANGTQEDYRSLLALKTMDYKDMSIADFNARLLAWADEDFDRMERIDADTQWNDFQASLNEEERTFVRLTAHLSGTENGELVQSIYTSQAQADPVYPQALPQKLQKDGKHPIWCDLYYQFSYHIADRGTVTVGERDQAVSGMVSAIEEFWDEATLEDLLAMTEDDIISRLASLAAEYSTDGITITIPGERAHFEHAEERTDCEVRFGKTI